MAQIRLRLSGPDGRAEADLAQQECQGGIPPGAKGEAVVTRLSRGIRSRRDLETIRPRPAVNETGCPSQPSWCLCGAQRLSAVVAAVVCSLRRLSAHRFSAPAFPAGRLRARGPRPAPRLLRFIKKAAVLARLEENTLFWIRLAAPRAVFIVGAAGRIARGEA